MAVGMSAGSETRRSRSSSCVAETPEAVAQLGGDGVPDQPADMSRQKANMSSSEIPSRPIR